MFKLRRTKGGAKGAEAHCPDAKEVEKTFWFRRPDGWVNNKKTKRIIMLEFKRASDTEETYYSDMKSIEERQHTPILGGLNALAGERGWVVEVLPLVVSGQRSIREKEWLEVMKTFGISAEDGKRIIYRLGNLLQPEHEKLLGRYWRQVFGPPSTLMHLLGKDLSVRPQTLPTEDGSRTVAGPFFFRVFIYVTCIFYYLSLSGFLYWY